jgi:HD-GYP domain-containing protein (c-di-GMP phosphodiesterase class II)
MNDYKTFVRLLVRNYVLGSLVAIICVLFLFFIPLLNSARQEQGALLWVMGVSTLTLLITEYRAFRWQLGPIGRLFEATDITEQMFMDAYLRVHHLPILTVKRLLGPHLVGFLVPAFLIIAYETYVGILYIPLFYLVLATIGSVLMAGMHAVVEFFMTAELIQGLLGRMRQMAQTLPFAKDVTLDGNVLVTINRKFILSALLIGTFPLFLFGFAAQVNITRDSLLATEYWRWAVIVFVLGIAFASLSAYLMSRAVQQPIQRLQDLMGHVQEGKFDVRATDLYSDEFSRLVTGFNTMVEGLERRDQLNSQLLDSYFTTLAAALDARDPYTAGHSIRVAHFSTQIGLREGLPSGELDLLKKSALLHDIGKIGIRDNVLLKEGKLTDEEFAQIKQHPAMGEAILRQIQPADAMAPLLPGVRSHHERYDGRGYPDGLAATDIPLFGRIIAVADAFDAMTSDRPYRKGMPVEKALAILDEGRGTQWDPIFVQYFVEWVNAQEGALEKKFDHPNQLERVM